jgi:hypothetical protein
MRKAFEVLRDRPKLYIRLTRDSVCAGDDCGAPHEKTVSVLLNISPPNSHPFGQGSFHCSNPPDLRQDLKACRLPRRAQVGCRGLQEFPNGRRRKPSCFTVADDFRLPVANGFSHIGISRDLAADGADIDKISCLTIFRAAGRIVSDRS